MRAQNVLGLSEAGEETDSIFTKEEKLDIDYDKLGENTLFFFTVL